ncbi:AAA family ATPase [Mycobacterium hackensackense]|uniref:ParA family protein n=1 Tax=Mycobacterium hackensackense TaxID=228909 RepID=UPI002265E7D5|nr:AAA family ATPase [Mycobacterium hackensackense]MCV7256809.1 AAA family ATPase [Mycobacterium hackensackense]
MKKTAIANQKGGVGKTATVLGLCSAATALGHRILAVDLDPQGNLTRGLGVDASQLGDDTATANELLLELQEGTALDAVVASPWPGIDVIPATLDLANRDLDGANDVIFRLRAAFEGCDLSAYDAVLFDCPPSVGRLLVGALVAADQVIYVTEASIDSLGGIKNVQDTTSFVKKRVNPAIEIAGIVITKRENNGEEEFREAEIRDVYGDLVAKTVIPKRAAWKDANGLATPIHSMRGSAGARALSTAFTDLFLELPITEPVTAGR